MNAEVGGSAPLVLPTPPYAAYVSFDAVIQRAADEAIPPVVDKALLVNWDIAGGNESALLTSLRSLGIIDEGGRPTDAYREIRLSPPRRLAAFRRCVEVGYPGLPSGDVDENQLHDYFVERRGLTGQMVNKAMRFYRQLIQAAASAAPATDPASAGRVRPARRPARANSSAPSVVQESFAGLPPVIPVPRPPRARPAMSRRAIPPLDLSLQIQVSAGVSEVELIELFRRVRRAWIKSLRPGTEAEG